MDRRPRRWHQLPLRPDGLQPRRRRGRPPQHLIILLIITGCVVVIGLSAPSVWFESVLAYIGFR